MHLPSAPITQETPPLESEEEVNENNGGGGGGSDVTLIEAGADEENLVPIGETGGSRSPDGSGQQHQAPDERDSTTRKPSLTGRSNGGVRHHDSRPRPGGKGSGFRHPASCALVWAAVVFLRCRPSSLNHRFFDGGLR